MAKRPLPTLLRYLHRLRAAQGEAALPDKALLQRFRKEGDQAAFEVLLWRYGPMVWGLGRRLLGTEQDAEDVFQATFLVLARRAGAVGKPGSLGSWLHQVAFRLALRVRAKAAKRTAAEKRRPSLSTAAPPATPTDLAARRQLRAVVDEEVAGLPGKYRAPVILCYLQGKTYAEAAEQLNLPKGTVSIRLLRARQLLRGRLTRRGLAFPAGALAGLLAQEAAPAMVPGHLVGSAFRAGISFAGGQAVTGAVVSAQAVCLMKGVLQAMFWTRVKIATAVVLTVLGVGLGLWAYQPAAAETSDRGTRAAPKPAGKAADKDKTGRPKDLIPALVEALQDEDAEIRDIASDTLVRLGRKAVPALVEVIGGKDRQLRTAAIEILSKIGPEACEAVPVLIKVYRDKREAKDVRRAAIGAIRNIVTGAQKVPPGMEGSGAKGMQPPGIMPQQPGGAKAPGNPFGNLGVRKS
jgi:RNA polymerase sigma factor (sigma-70 family)